MYKSADKFKRPARLVGFLFFTVLLLAGGYFFDLPSLIFGGLALGGAIVLCFLYAHYSMSDLEASREGYHAGCQGEEVFFKTALVNKGNIPLYMPLIEDTFPPSEHPSQCRLLVGVLPPGSMTESHYSAYCFRRRGVYQLGPMRVVHSDPLGLFPLEETFPNEMDFWVYPYTFQVDLPSAQGSRRVFSSSYQNPSKSGRSLEYLGVREYRHGDSHRLIHWPASAHRGKLIVKQFEQYVNQQVTIFMDMYDDHFHGLGQKSTLEYQVQICASLTQKAIDEGHWVQLIAGSDHTHHVPFGRGSYHLRRILQTLVEVHQDGDQSLSQMLSRYKHEIPPNSSLILFVIAEELDQDEFFRLVRFFRSRDITVFCILLEVTGFIRRDSWKKQPGDMRKQQQQIQNHLEDIGVETILVGTEQPLEHYFAG